MGISKASAKWDGNIKTGKGVMSPAHGSDIPFSLGSRFEGQPGSNPEELLGAALPGLDAAKFQAIAEETKKGCPVSKALASVGSITLKASLSTG